MLKEEKHNATDASLLFYSQSEMIGVENLQGSGYIAGETSTAYDEVFFIFKFNSQLSFFLFNFFLCRVECSDYSVSLRPP